MILFYLFFNVEQIFHKRSKQKNFSLNKKSLKYIINSINVNIKNYILDKVEI